MSASDASTVPVTWATDVVKDPEAQKTAQETVQKFHELYFEEQDTTITATQWLGVRTIKCPLDLWAYQELLHALLPNVIVECGTGQGGSAHYLASLGDLLDCGRIVTIDVWEPPDPRPEHERITYLAGSSVAPEIVDRVRDEVGDAERVMVLLDSNHAMHHVLEELRIYAPMVTPGSYLVVEDTNRNAWRRKATPGPLEAVQTFLAEDDRFRLDRYWEKFFMTFNPGGFLQRVPWS